MTDTTAPAATADVPIAAGAATPSPFRWRLDHRPDVHFGHAAGGVAGVLVGAAVVAFAVAVSGDDPTLPGVAFTAGLIVVALLAGWRLRGPVRSAAVAAIAVAVPILWLFAILGDSGGSRGDFRLVLLLTVASYVVLYLLSWTRGRAVLLGLALLFAASWVVFEVARQDAPFGVEVAGQAQSGFGTNPDDVLPSGNGSSDAAAADLVVAVALLGAGVLLDRRGRAGAATPFLLVGGLYAVNAAIAWGIEADDVYATGAFVAFAGLIIGLAGSLGRRRGTSWIGAIVLLAGVVTVITQATADTASGGGDAAAWRFGVFALAGAAMLLAAGILVARSLAEPVDGGEPPPHAPRTSELAPVGGPTAGAGAAAVGDTTPVTWSAETAAPDTPAPDTPAPGTPAPDERPTDATEGGSAEPPSNPPSDPETPSAGADDTGPDDTGPDDTGPDDAGPVA